MLWLSSFLRFSVKFFAAVVYFSVSDGSKESVMEFPKESVRENGSGTYSESVSEVFSEDEASFARIVSVLAEERPVKGLLRTDAKAFMSEG